MHGLLCYGGIMNNRFKLYHVNIKYIRALHNIDDNVPSVSPQVRKHLRPFLGIIVLINNSKFCIPLTSNSIQKKKLATMHENITFRKIYDKSGKLLAALNLNNMIPIQDEYLSEINLKIRPTDSQELCHWKKLCIKELDWCQKHQKEIERLANELYNKYTSDEHFNKRKICLNFPALEKECRKNKKY